MSSLWFNASADLKPDRHPDLAYRYTVRAVADPSVLSRVVELFALRDLIPTHVECRLLGVQAPELRVDVSVAGLEPAQADHLAVRMRQFPMVLNVLMEQSQVVAEARPA